MGPAARLLLLGCLLLVPLGLTARAGPGEGGSYTDQDISRMKGQPGLRPLATPRHLPAGRGPGIPLALLGSPYQPPRLVPWLLPYPRWEPEYRLHFQRLYGDSRLTLEPTMIVMHYTVTPSAQAVWEGFVRGCRMSQGDHGDSFGHPSVHLMVDRDGTALQLLPLDRRCTGAYGVDHVALSIELVATTEADLLSRRGQLLSSFRLVRWLTRTLSIQDARVVGHYEVSAGRAVVPDYTDQADSAWPDRYPPASARSDPGRTYMSWLRAWLKRHP